MAEARTPRRTFVFAAVFAALSGSCSNPVAPTAAPTPVVVTPADPRAALAEAERRWASWRLQNYDIVVHNGCFLCPPPHQVRFEVRNGVSRAVGVDGATVRYFTGLETVEGHFARTRRYLDAVPVRFEATYDPVYGYPVLVVGDIDALTADDEFAISIDEFVVR